MLQQSSLALRCALGDSPHITMRPPLLQDARGAPFLACCLRETWSRAAAGKSQGINSRLHARNKYAFSLISSFQ
jgi:hypothetical protein